MESHWAAVYHAVERYAKFRKFCIFKSQNLKVVYERSWSVRKNSTCSQTDKPDNEIHDQINKQPLLLNCSRTNIQTANPAWKGPRQAWEDVFYGRRAPLHTYGALPGIWKFYSVPVLSPVAHHVGTTLIFALYETKYVSAATRLRLGKRGSTKSKWCMALLAPTPTHLGSPLYHDG